MRHGAAPGPRGSDLTCTFDLGRGQLDGRGDRGVRLARGQPSRDGFAWTVLAALTNVVAAEVDGDRLTITLARGHDRRRSRP